MLETVEATAEVFTSHTADKNNPHNVTKEQVGLSNVDNTADMDKPVSNAVNSAINTFKEENSKEHTKIHSAINTFKEESEITFTEINNVIEALQTNIQQAEQLIGSLRDETNTALANKADSNHNHDSTYSKTSHTHTGYAASSHNHDTVYLKSATAASQYAAKSHTHSNYAANNHTHTGYAASSHSHAFSAITGSMAITDKRLTGNLPISRVSGAAGKPTITVTDSAKWIEIPLNNGEVLLYGYGVVTESEVGAHSINLPKTVKKLGQYNILGGRIDCYGHVTITAGYVGASFANYYSGACPSNKAFILSPAYQANGNLNGCTWEYVGILA